MEYRSLILLFCLFASCAMARDSGAIDSLFGFHLDAAKGGNPESMYIVGNYFENGRGTQINYNEAIKWYSRAAKMGNERALSRIDDVLKKKRAKLNKNNSAKTTKSKKYKKLKTDDDKRLEADLKQEMQKARSLRKELEQDKAAVNQAREDAERAAGLLQQQLEIIKLEADKARQKAEKLRRQQEQLAMEKQKLQRLQERRTEEENAQGDDSDSLVKESTSGFKSNPCDGPGAKFMSTCR